jgi:hypothetical protein
MEDICSAPANESVNYRILEFDMNLHLCSYAEHELMKFTVSLLAFNPIQGVAQGT